MAKTTSPKKQAAPKSKPQRNEAFKLRDSDQAYSDQESTVHVLAPGIVCDTEARGHETPRGRTPIEIVVDASEGFIPLWAPDTTIHWRFRERAMTHFENPEAARTEIRKLFGEAVLAWGEATPVKFTEDEDVWDFEIVTRSADDCTPNGCVLASAFFPDAGRHEFVVYPKMFTQERKEQVDTFIHEIGHIFGLRHFFANISETAWPSEIFGKHEKFSIMNYGSLSELTKDDVNDLKLLYAQAWSGELTHINGTPIRFVKPFSSLAVVPTSAFALGHAAAIAPNGTGSYLNRM